MSTGRFTVKVEIEQHHLGEIKKLINGYLKEQATKSVLDNFRDDGNKVIKIKEKCKPDDASDEDLDKIAERLLSKNKSIKSGLTINLTI